MQRLFIITLFLFPINIHAQLSPEQDTYTRQLIEQFASSDSAKAYSNLSLSDKPAFLKTFWQSHNPLIYKYYYGHLFGERAYSVSEFYIENQLPERFRTGAQPPDSTHTEQARKIFEQLTQQFPDDPVALNAYGYALLEADQPKTAEPIFLKAVKKDRKLVEARNGRGLAYFKIPKQRHLAIKQFQNAAAQNKKYAAALYNLAQCQVAMDARDLAFHFNQVVKRFPDHLDAHFKLGVVYENEKPQKALEAFDKQITVNPNHYGAYLGKGRVLLAQNQAQQAIETWQKLNETAPHFRPQTLPLIMQGYQKTGNAAKALSAASSYIRTLDEQTQMIFRDIRLLATAK